MSVRLQISVPIFARGPLGNTGDHRAAYGDERRMSHKIEAPIYRKDTSTTICDATVNVCAKKSASLEFLARCVGSLRAGNPNYDVHRVVGRDVWM